jgi:predicted TPR repeat methyltransferase
MNDNHLDAGLQLANQLAAAGRCHDALSVAEQLVRQYPQVARAHFSRAMALVLLDRHWEAAAAYRAGLEREAHPGAYRNLAQTLEKVGQRQEAIVAYQQSLDLAPDDAKSLGRLAVLLQAEGQFESSAALLTSALASAPEDAYLWFHLGNARAEQSRYGEALEAYQRARDLRPQSAGIQYNMGHVLSLLGRWQESVAAFRQAVCLAPDYVKAYIEMGIAQVRQGDAAGAEQTFRTARQVDGRSWEAAVCLGDLLASQDRLEEALGVYQHAASLAEEKTVFRLGLTCARVGRLDEAARWLQRAHELDPRDEQTLKFLGMVHWQRDSLSEAERAFRTAIELKPDDRDGYKYLVQILIHSDRRDQAIPLLEQWRQNMPDDPVAQHFSRAADQRDGQRASDDFVCSEFDGFADSFDEVLGALDYRAPELVGQAVTQAVRQWGRRVSILDAGCGTGLCAAHLAPLANRLDGVDLSEKMLARAAERKQYDQLVSAELTEYLAACARPYDVVVAADTLCYFGDLAPVCRAAAQATCPAGVFCFTVENLEPDLGRGAFQLNLTGRFSHSESHVRQALGQAGFHCESLQKVELRKEAGEPVIGQLVVAFKSSGG